MAGGKIKAESSNVKTFEMKENDYNYVVSLENAKSILINGIDATISKLQMTYLHKAGIDQFGLKSDVNYKFDLDLTIPPKDKKNLSVEEVKTEQTTSQ